jgi:hypothetical protein
MTFDLHVIDVCCIFARDDVVIFSERERVEKMNFVVGLLKGGGEVGEANRYMPADLDAARSNGRLQKENSH